jgi:hypothetical protein
VLDARDLGDVLDVAGDLRQRGRRGRVLFCVLRGKAEDFREVARVEATGLGFLLEVD